MSLHKNICAKDIVTVFKPLIKDGSYMVNHSDGKIWSTSEFKGDMSVEVDCPWMYTNNPINYHCTWWRNIADLFGFVHSKCMACYKVVVRPNSFEELFKLNVMQQMMVQADPECYCKCGTEDRDYVNGSYGGYFYCRGLQQGLDRYKEVRQMVDGYLGPDVSVTLKRGCTELEMNHGDTTKYEETEMSKWWENEIEEGCYMVVYDKEQSELMKIKVMRDWMKRAWAIGDPTVLKYTDGEPLAPPCVTYHDMSDDEIKELLDKEMNGGSRAVVADNQEGLTEK
jgi:hypothetical protein